MEKMRTGMVVLKLTHEECLTLMFEVLADPDLHMRASDGFKKLGPSADLHGAEEALIVRNAGAYWNEETSDQRHSNMRPNINAEIAAVAEEYHDGGIAWNMRDVKRLICAYPQNGQPAPFSNIWARITPTIAFTT